SSRSLQGRLALNRLLQAGPRRGLRLQVLPRQILVGLIETLWRRRLLWAQLLLRARRAGLPRAALRDDVAAHALRRVRLANDALVAGDRLLRNPQRHRAGAQAGSAANSKAAGATRQRAERGAVAASYFNAADPAVGVGIELDVVGRSTARRRADLDQ